MAERFLQKVSNTNQIVDKPTAAGVGVKSGNAYIHNGTNVRALAQCITSGQTRIASGQATTVTASDTIATGLSTVVAVVAGYDTDPADANTYVSASIGDQAGSPTAGSFLLKTWKTTGTDPTPVAADSFGKKVNWIAIGS